MNKQQIRQHIRQLGQHLSTTERQCAADMIFSQIEQLEPFAAARNVAIYLELSDEVPTQSWIKRAQSLGKRIFVPRVVGDDMEFYEYDRAQLNIGSYKILEPTGTYAVDASSIDLMILPGVAFCTDGRRLGRGKGYYDRYLSRSGFRAYNIGIGFTHQLIYEIPCESHDRVLDRVITPLATSPIPQIMSRVVDSAWGDADRLGCGVERLIESGHSWVLLRYKMELVRTPEADEELNIETWISACSRVVTSRNFVIKSSAGELLGEAISQWCMIDLESRRPLDLTGSEINYNRHVTPRKGEISISGKLPSIEPSQPSIITHKHLITPADIDFNQHVNTFRYVEMMLEMLPQTTLAERGALSIEIQFIHESYLGEELTIHLAKDTQNSTDTPTSLFEILRPDGSSALRARFSQCCLG